MPSRSSTPVAKEFEQKYAHSPVTTKRKAYDWSESSAPKKSRLFSDEILNLSNDEEGYGSSSSGSPTTSHRLIEWTGPNGGPVKFFAKPANYDEDALSRWSFSPDKPKNDEDKRVEGDIHFSPTTPNISSDNPFTYWVCVWKTQGPLSAGKDEDPSPLGKIELL
ncbi:hypothetical protein FRC08_006959 [Ceratobasidium sp. 394]|nr:hypothetical protein FRC08_006959 [Ceratobasidium sp. 394]